MEKQALNSKAKTIVVTGATKGLGRALVLELARRGHVVAGCGRDGRQVGEVGRLIKAATPAGATGGAAAAHIMEIVDVASDEEVREFATRVMASLGIPDIVVNNAGLMNANRPLWEVPRAEFDTLIDVNVKGTANVIRHFAPRMVKERRQGGGAFVNFSSGWGRSASADVAPYCASKWAIEGLTKAFAQELPAGMVAVALNPGVIDTAMLQQCFGGSAGAYQKPEEWAPRCADLILGLQPSDNGASLNV